MLLTATSICAGPNGDLTAGCFMGDNVQGMAAGMWATMPEWARTGLCVILAVVLISAVLKLVGAIVHRAIGITIIIVVIVLFHQKIPQAYDWFRHLPIVNGS